MWVRLTARLTRNAILVNLDHVLMITSHGDAGSRLVTMLVDDDVTQEYDVAETLDQIMSLPTVR
jgi:hypothetical protein